MHDVLIIHNALRAHEAELAAREPSHRFSSHLHAAPDADRAGAPPPPPD